MHSGRLTFFRNQVLCKPNMFNRIKKLFSTKVVSADTEHVIIPRSEHHLSDALISPNALIVIEKLQQCGYPAFLVGGGIRDILLDSDPKDFDVATNATPEQVKRLFRNAMIIGRRFRIVHVRFGREIIEVTTFRAHHDLSNNRTQTGMLLRDNVYGDIESDAIRRDFTVNALYYNPTNGELLDYTQGLRDLQARELNIIGDPDARYREDPVRMLRAIRFSAKLGFAIGERSARPIVRLAPLIREVSSARLFDEILKLMMNGSATATFHLLREFGIFEQLFPATASHLHHDQQSLEMLNQATVNTDKRIRQGKRVTPAFIYAVFLWPPLQAAMQQLIDEQHCSPQEALQQAAQGIISQQLAATAIPKRFLIPMREIWGLQLRLPKRDEQKAFALLEHPRFRAAYDFLLLREDAGENLDNLGQWWTKFQEADQESQEKMTKELSTPKKRRRRPRKKRPTSTQPPQSE